LAEFSPEQNNNQGKTIPSHNFHTLIVTLLCFADVDKRTCETGQEIYKVSSQFAQTKHKRTFYLSHVGLVCAIFSLPFA